MIPPVFLIALFVKLCDTHTVLVRRDMLGNNIHSDLAQVHIRSHTCRCRDACCIKNILYQHSCKAMTVRLVCA